MTKMTTVSAVEHWSMLLGRVLLAGMCLAACSDDSASSDGADSGADHGGTGGTGGGGSGGDSGAGGAGGASGSGGVGGTSGSGGSGGTGGTDSGVDASLEDDAGSPDAGGDAGDAGPVACEAVVPTTWDGTAFDTNAAVELGLRTRIGALNTRMQSAEVEVPPATTVTDFQTLFVDGDPSPRDAMTASFRSVVDHVFDRFVLAVGSTLDPSVSWNPTPASNDVGGRLCGPSGTPTSGCWLMTAGGVDLRQIFSKGVHGAALYHQARLLAAGAVTPAVVDRIGALFGANSALDINGTNSYAADYAKQMGFYATMRGHFIAAKAYAQEGASCADELDQELAALFATWERSQFARFVYYANRALVLFSSGTATEAQNAEALHWLGEGVGLVWGFEGLPSDTRIVSDAQIDQLRMLMKLTSIATASVYEFRVGNIGDLEDIEAAFDLVQAVYGFTDAQVNGQFRVHPTTPG